MKTNFVFSGGGARGAWQWELFHELESLFDIESVTGSSTGTLTALCVAKKIPAEYMRKLYDDVYASNAREIFKPGIGSIKNGKFKLNDWKFIPKLVFARNKIKGAMSAEPLIALIEKIHNDFPEFHYDFSCCAVDLHTSKSVYFRFEDFESIREFAKAVAASCAIPGLVEPIRDIVTKNGTYKCCVDGGVREGLPLKQAFSRMKKENSYQVVVEGCNTPDATPTEELGNIFGIFGATGTAVLNEMMLDDIDKVERINELVKEKGELVMGKRYIPIHKIFYKDGGKILEFTPEGLQSFRESAKKDAERFRTLIGHSNTYNSINKV